MLISIRRQIFGLMSSPAEGVAVCCLDYAVALYPLVLRTVCGTDLHTFHGEVPAYVPTATKPHPITGETLPVILGHEYVASA